MKHFTLKLNQLWRLTALLVAIAFCHPQSAKAQSVEIDGVYYTFGADTAMVAQSYNHTGDIVIPGTVTYNGQTYTVTAIGPNAFNYCSKVTSVTIGPNVKWIQYNAFRYTSITSITIPASVVYINYPVFDGCENLETIVVEAGNPKYDSRGGCNAIIETAKNALMCGCKNTVIPNDVTEIKNKALGFKSLTSIEIPASVRILQPGVFEGSGLTSVVIPATLTTIFDNPFQDCPDLTSIVVEAGNSRYDSRDNCNAIIETYYNRLVTSCSTTVIPESVTSIGEMSFCRRYDLTTFTVPDQIKEVARNAFYDCTNLESITFSDNIELIDQAAFYWCDNLKTVTIGSGIKQMGEAVFGRCNKLTKVYINATTPPITTGDPFYDGNAQVVIYVPDEAVDAYESTSPWSMYHIEGSGGTMVGDTYTFNGATPYNTGSGGTTKYADLSTEEGPNWWGVYFSAPSDAPFSYTTIDGEGCIKMGNSSEQLDVIVENDEFQINGPIKKVIVRAGGNFKYMTCEIQTMNSDNQWETQEEKYLEATTTMLNDYAFQFAGNEYTDAKIRVSLGGLTPSYIRSIMIVSEESGSSGPKLSGTSGDVTWELTDLGDIVTMWDYDSGQYVDNHTYRLTFSGNGSTGDYESTWNSSTSQYEHNAPWVKAGVIKEVVVNEGVTRLGSYLLYEQRNIEHISLPSTLRTIDYYALQSCTGLTEIELPEGLQVIGNYGIGFCSGIEEIHIPASVTTMYAHSFQGTHFKKFTIDEANPNYYSPAGSQVVMRKGTTEVLFGSPYSVIPDNVTSIGADAFYNAYIKTTMVIPNGVTTIGNAAFYYCNYMTEMELPASVTTIGDRAFGYCSRMTKFTIGSGVTSIGKEQFTSTKNNNVPTSVLADVYCYADPNTLSWTDYANANSFMADKATKFHVPANYLQAWQTKFPDINATYVGDLEGGDTPTLAYSGTTGDLTWEAYLIGTDKYRLVISGTGSMGDYTMSGNTGTTAPWNDFKDQITEVLINEGALNVGTYAFSRCPNLTTVSLPNTVTTISQRAFAETAITALTLPSSLKTIDKYIIFDCPSLKSLTIPASVTNIATMALQNNHLTSLTVASGNTKYDSRNNCNAIIETATNTLIAGTVNTVFPSDVTTIGERAFSQVDITTMDIPEGVTSIGEEAFYNCEALTEVTIPNTVTTIGLSCFASCSKLLTVTIGTGVTTIANGLFSSSQFVDDVYCYANPATLTWTGYDRTDFFKGSFKATKFHVPANYLQAWQTKFPNINATYVGDLVNPAATDYKILVFGVNVTSENCADIKAPGVTGHINYEPTTNVLTLQDVTADGTNQDWTWAVVWANGFFSNHEEFNMTILLKGTNVITNSGEAFGGHNFTFVGDGASAKLTVNGRKRAINAIQEAVIDGCILDLTSTERDAIGANKLSIKNGAYVHLKSPEGQLLTEITEKPIFDAGIEILTASVNFSRKQNSDNQWVWCFTLDATPDEGSVLNATEVTIGAPKGATINGIHYSFDPITLQATVVSDATAKYTGDINIPENVTFEGNNYTVTAIDEWAFDECNEVTSITLPSTLTFIGQDAFSYCDNVKELIIPASVTVIGSGAFNGMRGLETLRVEEGNPVYDSRENCNAVIRTAQNEVYGACKNTTYPASVTAMGRAALLNHFELTSIDLPENITYIGFNSMSGAMNATTVRLRGQISHIGPFNFTYYTKLKDFYIYSTQVPAVQSNVFFDEYDLKTDLSQATLHVPAASVEDYKNADVWKDFGEIVAIQDDIADISPITEEKIVEMIKISTSTLDDAIVDEVYYNLDSEKGNGYNENDNCIVIAETTDMNQIEDKQPGSEEVQNEFKGIILKVEAGKGVLSIDVKTVGNNKLAVQFGNYPPTLKQSNEKQTIQIGYNVKRATYIYIYAVSGAAGVKGQFLAPSAENGVNIYGFSIDPTIDEMPENIPVVDEEQLATDIAKIEAGREGNIIYDISGRRTGNAIRKQGIYIANKRKVAVK